MSVLQEINPHVRNMKPLQYAILASRAVQINKELREVNKTIIFSDSVIQCCCYCNQNLHLFTGSQKALSRNNRCFLWWPTQCRGEASDVCSAGSHRMFLILRQDCTDNEHFFLFLWFAFISRFLLHAFILSFWTAAVCQWTSSREFSGCLEHVLVGV